MTDNGRKQINIQPRPQALFSQRQYGGKTGSARDDGPEALREAPGRTCVHNGGAKYHRLRKGIFKW